MEGKLVPTMYEVFDNYFNTDYFFFKTKEGTWSLISVHGVIYVLDPKHYLSDESKLALFHVNTLIGDNYLYGWFELSHLVVQQARYKVGDLIDERKLDNYIVNNHGIINT